MAMPFISQIPLILRALQNLATEVRTLVHPNPEHAGSLQDKDLYKLRRLSINDCASELSESINSIKNKILKKLMKCLTHMSYDPT